MLSDIAFDKGYVIEAKKIATTLRMILHDTDRSHSILNQLKLKTKMRYFNMASPYNEKFIKSLWFIWFNL